MQKLTKEQAEWLIETARLHADSSTQRWEQVFSMDRLQAIIDKCTEKEFPNYQFIDPDDCDFFVNIVLHCSGDVSSEPTVRIGVCSGYLNLFASEFKKFTEGCNKIVEWLNEQEK